MSNDAVNTFLANLRKAQILEEAQLAEVELLGQTAARPAEVAAALIKRGRLTPYQANQVARGRGGELVLGSYVILEPIGSGGMGQVVKARHRYMQRQVALKFIRRDQRESADTSKRFQREVQLLAELRHPHIVQAYDAGIIGDIRFMAMEMLDGVDLDRLVRKCGPLPIGQACACIRQAALGLGHAHERSLVHRDIKPSNLFLTGEGIKLLDLGLARPQAVSDASHAGDLTGANTVMGTPDYLAPEQALDPRRADARSDLYSLGCTLFSLLTGRPPFPEGTLAQKLLYHQTVEPPAVESLRPDVPPPLADLVRRLLAKVPAQRPASAAEVAAALAPLATTIADGVATALLAAASSGAPPSGPSLVNGRAVTPERGFTLPVESLPPTATASLVNAKAATPERGFTLVAESMPPTAAYSSLVNAKAEAPERGFTLTAESLPPAPIPASQVQPASGSYERGWTLAVESQPPTVQPPVHQEQPVEGQPVGPPPLPRPPSRSRTPKVRSIPDSSQAPRFSQRQIVVGLSVGGGALALMLLLIVIGQFKGCTPVVHKKPGPEFEQPNKTDKATDPGKAVEQAPKEIVDLWRDLPPVQILEPNGQNESPDIAMKPFAADPGLLNRLPFTKVFLSDMQEFGFTGNPLGWNFGKNGLMGGPFASRPPITVNGKPFPKALHTHPPPRNYTRVCYVLGKKAKSLHGSAALADERNPGAPKPTRYVIIADGKVRWRSKVLSQYGAKEDFRLDVSAVDVLELRCFLENGGPDIRTDAVWLDPFVVVDPNPPVAVRPIEPGEAGKAKNKPPSLDALGPKETEDVKVMANIAADARLANLKPGESVFLSDMNEFAFKTTPTNWKFAKQGRVGDPRDPNSMIRVNGAAYPNGLGMHPPNTDYIRVCYALGNRGKSLRGAVALDDGDDPPWRIERTYFVVIGDGKVLWRSQGHKDRSVIEPFNVDVRDVTVLELRVYTDYAGANGSRAVWLDPQLLAAEND